MANREIFMHPARTRRDFHAALLGGVSFLALMVASDVGEARNLNSIGSVVAPTAAAQQAAVAAAQQAAAAAAQAKTSLGRAAAALVAARKLQQDAAAAGSPSSIPNGLAPGGLMPSGGNASDPLAGIRPDVESGNPSKWIGAGLPTQTNDGSQVRVD